MRKISILLVFMALFGTMGNKNVYAEVSKTFAFGSSTTGYTITIPNYVGQAEIQMRDYDETVQNVNVFVAELPSVDNGTFCTIHNQSATGSGENNVEYFPIGAIQERADKIFDPQGQQMPFGETLPTGGSDNIPSYQHMIDYVRTEKKPYAFKIVMNDTYSGYRTMDETIVFITPDMKNQFSYEEWTPSIESGNGNQIISDEKATEITVRFNGKKLDFTLPVINQSDRSYYPMRELLESMGATVDWDGVTSTVTGVLGDQKVTFVVGSDRYTVNGASQTMDATTFIANGRTYIPVRYAAEALGFKVDWDGINNTIVIK